MEKEMQILMAVVAKDAHYQMLLRQCDELGTEYERIRSTLPEADQELLDRYVSVCENMEYRRLRIAMAIWAGTAL